MEEGEWYKGKGMYSRYKTVQKSISSLKCNYIYLNEAVPNRVAMLPSRPVDYSTESPLSGMGNISLRCYSRETKRIPKQY